MITAKELREATMRGEGPLFKAHEDEPVSHSQSARLMKISKGRERNEN